MIFAAQVFYIASQNPIKPIWVKYAITMDVLWVVGSFLLLITNALSLSTIGNWVVLMIADIVLIFATLQFYGLRQMTKR